MARFPSPQVTLRDANKLATTNMHNELAAALLAQQPPYTTGQGRPARGVPFLFTASISAFAPDGSKYTDARYGVNPLSLGGGAGTNDAISGTGSQGPQVDAALLGASVVTATNLAETSWGNLLGLDTHLLLPGQIVRCWAWVDVGAAPDSQHKDGIPAAVHYVFNRPPPEKLAVVLSVDGGTNPNYTYTMQYRGVVLNTHQSPRSPRYTTSVSAATFGDAHIDPATSGKYVLGWCNEAPDTFVCT